MAQSKVAIRRVIIATFLLGLASVEGRRPCLRRAEDKTSKVVLLPGVGQARHGERQLYHCEGGLQAHGVKFSDTGYSYVLCNDGKWIPEPMCVGGLRSCARAVSNHDVTFLPSGGHTRSGDLQLYRCPSGFNAKGTKFSAREYSYAMCNDGMWDPHPECQGNPCERVNTSLVRFPMRGIADHGHRQLFKCHNSARTVSGKNFGFINCKNGTWAPLPRCFPRGCVNGFEKFESKYCSGEALIRNWLKKSILECTTMCNLHDRCTAMQHDSNYCKLYEDCKLTTAYYNTYTVYMKTEQCKPR